MDDRLHTIFQQMSDEVPRPSENIEVLRKRGHNRAARNAIAFVTSLLIVATGSYALVRTTSHKQAYIPIVATPSPSLSHIPGVDLPVDKNTKEVSALSSDGQFRCRAKVPETVHPGWLVSAEVTLENTTSHAIQYWPQIDSSLQVTKADGVVLSQGSSAFDQWRRPSITRATLGPHSSIQVVVIDRTQVRWDGTLVLHVRCNYFNQQPIILPQVTANVLVPGPTPTSSDALSRALSARPGLLDKCKPVESGQWVNGELTPPSHGKVPQLTAHCGAVVKQAKGFDVVELRVLAPASLPNYTFPNDSLDRWAVPPGVGGRGSGFPSNGTYGAMRWFIVVTANDVFDDGKTESASHTRPAVGHYSPDLSWQDHRWSTAGDALCGGTGNIFEWLTYCPA